MKWEKHLRRRAAWRHFQNGVCAAPKNNKQHWNSIYVHMEVGSQMFNPQIPFVYFAILVAHSQFFAVFFSSIAFANTFVCGSLSLARNSPFALCSQTYHRTIYSRFICLSNFGIQTNFLKKFSKQKLQAINCGVCVCETIEMCVCVRGTRKIPLCIFVS